MCFFQSGTLNKRSRSGGMNSMGTLVRNISVMAWIKISESAGTVFPSKPIRSPYNTRHIAVGTKDASISQLVFYLLVDTLLIYGCLTNLQHFITNQFNLLCPTLSVCGSECA